MCFIASCSVDVAPIAKKFVRGFHRHTTEIGNKVSTIGMTSYITLGTLASIFASKREHVTAMTAPISANVCERFEAMWDTMINLLLVALLELRSVYAYNKLKETTTYTSVRFRYAFGNDFLVTFLVAGISTILALIPKSIEKEIITEGA